MVLLKVGGQPPDDLPEAGPRRGVIRVVVHPLVARPEPLLPGQVEASLRPAIEGSTRLQQVASGPHHLDRAGVGVDPLPVRLPLPLQEGQLAPAIELHVSGMSDVRHVEEGGRDIGEVGQLIGGTTGPDPGSSHHVGDVHPPFHPAILGGHRSAVVGAENEIGVLVDAQFLRPGDELADQFVHVLDEINETLALAPAVLREDRSLLLPVQAGDVGFPEFDVHDGPRVRGGGIRAVRDDGGPVGHEGLPGPGLARHEVHEEAAAVIGTEVGLGDLDVFPVPDHGGIPVAQVGKFEVLAFSAGDDVDPEVPLDLVRPLPDAEFVKPDRGIPRLFRTTVPFPSDGGLVAPLSQQPGPAVLGRKQGPAGTEGPHVVTERAGAVAVDPGHEEGAGGTTDGRGITGAETHALAGDPVDVRGAG